MFNVIITRNAEKVLDKLPTKYHRLLVKHILALEHNPRPHGYIKLVGLENAYRIRVGVYRVIYTIEDDVLTVRVIKIGHRSDVY